LTGMRTRDNVISKEVPGLKKEEIQDPPNGVLSISGERKSERRLDGAANARSERFVDGFIGPYTPSEVKGDQVNGPV